MAHNQWTKYKSTGISRRELGFISSVFDISQDDKTRGWITIHIWDWTPDYKIIVMNRVESSAAFRLNTC